MAKVTWMPEDEAMKIFGFTDKYHFRRVVKDRDRLGKDIVYTNPTARVYLYSKESIDKCLVRYASMAL